jgi:hypothetical protein
VNASWSGLLEKKEVQATYIEQRELVFFLHKLSGVHHDPAVPLEASLPFEHKILLTRLSYSYNYITILLFSKVHQTRRGDMANPLSYQPTEHLKKQPGAQTYRTMPEED